MGWNDHLDDDELSNLPPEAFNPFGVDGPFDPRDDWLSWASEDDQRIALRAWFLARYCDPAMETPYNGREGGYLFIHGGPYDPANELPKRFSGIVDDDVIEDVINELHDEGGDRWAPIHDRPEDYDFDARFDLSLPNREEPLTRLKQNLRHARLILTLEGDSKAKSLSEKLAFANAVTSLEAFLWETVDYWVEQDDAVLRNIVEKIPYLSEQRLKLGDIFKKYADIKKQVKGYLQKFVWHRWAEVVLLLEKGLEIKPPNFKLFDEALLKRHDIVHRGGRNKMGEPVEVTQEEIEELCVRIERCATEIQEQLASRATSSNEDF